ncbi:hypothetical protein E2P64_08205 [Candidatus Bathyarchaeota archaeon]|nr:hypothetical protein E2P64_08205 [Candidatus Bathyarchaeota archaeon]
MSWTIILANLAPVFLGLGAMAAFAWFLDNLMGDTYQPSSSNKDDEEGKGEATPTIDWRRGMVRLIGLIGIPMGILCFVSFAAILLTPGLNIYGDPLTLFLLAWMGIALFLTPINKLPWAALIGLAAGLIAVVAVVALAPIIPEIITQQIPLKYILIGIFIIVGVVVFTLFKWAENILDLITTIMGSRPFLLVLTFLALAQAIALPIVWFVFGGYGGLLWFFFH